MEFWLTVSKLIVFLYIVFSYIYANVVNLPWVIFTFTYLPLCKRNDFYI